MVLKSEHSAFQLRVYGHSCTFSILVFFLYTMRREQVCLEYSATSQRKIVGRTFNLFLGSLWKFLWLTEAAGVYC